MSPVSVEHYQVEISVMGGTCVQWSLTESGVWECDHAALAKQAVAP